MNQPISADLTAWIARLYQDPSMLSMGHNQQKPDLNLGLGWLYYALGRLVHPRQAVVIGSYRGFVPLVLGKALQDNAQPGAVTFIDPSLVDDFWKDPQAVERHFQSFGIGNLRHFPLTTQAFVETAAYRELDEIGLLFIDGLHTEEQARFDYCAFEARLAPRGFVLFHDSMVSRPSTIYGAGHEYDVSVERFIDELKRDAGLQILDIPFGTGLTLLRKLDHASAGPLLEGQEVPPGREMTRADGAIRR